MRDTAVPSQASHPLGGELAANSWIDPGGTPAAVSLTAPTISHVVPTGTSTTRSDGEGE